MKSIILLLALCSVASAQYAPQQPPPQTAIVYQPVAVQGYWQPVPRPLWIGNWLLGPIWTFQPIQQPQVPGPVQPQYQQPQSSRQMPATLRAVETPQGFVESGRPQTFQPFEYQQQPLAPPAQVPQQ